MLSFIHKTTKKRAHLRRMPSSKHNDSCSYNYEYASSKKVKEYVDSLTYNEIQDKLNSMLNMLCRQQKPDDMKTINNNDRDSITQNPMIIVERRENTNVLRALRRKNLNVYIDKSDGEDFSVFYGKVKLDICEKTNINKDTGEKYTFYLLEIFTHNKQGEWKHRTNIYRGVTKDKIDKQSIYNIVMIGRLNFKYRPFTIDLANRNAIKFREVRE